MSESEAEAGTFAATFGFAGAGFGIATFLGCGGGTNFFGAGRTGSGVTRVDALSLGRSENAIGPCGAGSCALGCTAAASTFGLVFATRRTVRCRTGMCK